VVLAFVIIASSLVAANFGIAMADNIPITTITNTNSIIVNAFLEDVCIDIPSLFHKIILLHILNIISQIFLICNK
jgi:hypothetical protein